MSFGLQWSLGHVKIIVAGLPESAETAESRSSPRRCAPWHPSSCSTIPNQLDLKIRALFKVIIDVATMKNLCWWGIWCTKVVLCSLTIDHGLIIARVCGAHNVIMKQSYRKISQPYKKIQACCRAVVLRNTNIRLQPILDLQIKVMHTMQSRSLMVTLDFPEVSTAAESV
jgi:hypothetical protein